MFNHAADRDVPVSSSKDATLPGRRWKLRQLKVGRCRFETALEVVKAHRGEKIKRGRSRIGYIVGRAIAATERKQRMIVGRGSAEHWGVGGGST